MLRKVTFSLIWILNFRSFGSFLTYLNYCCDVFLKPLVKFSKFTCNNQSWIISVLFFLLFWCSRHATACFCWWIKSQTFSYFVVSYEFRLFHGPCPCLERTYDDQKVRLGYPNLIFLANDQGYPRIHHCLYNQLFICSDYQKWCSQVFVRDHHLNLARCFYCQCHHSG